MFAMTIKAVFFDLDNTLTHRDQSVCAYSEFLIQAFNADLYPLDHHQELTVEIIRRIDNGGYPLKERLTHPSIAASVADALLNQLEWKNKPSLEHLTEFWFEQFGLAAVPMSGAEELLQSLKANQYRLAVISNGGHATRLKILEGLGFTNYFDQVFSSEMVGISKPQPDIFLHACETLGVQAEHCLYIGDHPINDYEGAVAAGLNAVLLNGFHPLSESQQAYQRIDHLKQVALLLNQ